MAVSGNGVTPKISRRDSDDFLATLFSDNKSDTSHENETLAIKNSRLMPSKLANLLAMGAHTRVIFLGDE
jgi:hypothetical protein